MQTLDKTFMEPLQTIYYQEIEKTSVQIQGESPPSSKLANNSAMHTSELQQAR
jgi:hypothetical protein